MAFDTKHPFETRLDKLSAESDLRSARPGQVEEPERLVFIRIIFADADKFKRATCIRCVDKLLFVPTELDERNQSDSYGFSTAGFSRLFTFRHWISSLRKALKTIDQWLLRFGPPTRAMHSMLT